MTAETLKPFITPSSDNFSPAHSTDKMKTRERSSSLLGISLSVIVLIVTVTLVGFTVWNSMRVCKLEGDVKSLNRVIENMQKRLGLNYLDELQDFEKEYQNALIDNPNTLDSIETNDDEDDDDDDNEDDDDTLIRHDDRDIDDDDDENDDDDDDDEYDEIESYDDLLKKYNSYDDSEEDEKENSSNLSDNDNLYDDFEKFKDSKKKKESSRKARSIAPVPNVVTETFVTHTSNKSEELTDANKESSGPLPVHYRNHKSSARSQLAKFDGSNQKTNFVSQRIDERRSPLRPRTHRKRNKMPIIKSGESLLSAKTTASHLNAIPNRAAAHFHLSHKIPNNQHHITLNHYDGDIYIGQPSWSTEPFFSVYNGVLTIKESGFYYVYAQLCYNNVHDRNGFVIFHGHTPFLQCLNTVPTNLPEKIHTCHTSGLIYLQANDTIHLRDIHINRNVTLKPSNNRSYFGIIKI